MPTSKRKTTPGGVAMRIKLDASALPGPGAAAGWGVGDHIARDDRLAAIRDLRDVGLSWLVVRRLLRALRHANDSQAVQDRWPTIGADRKVLEAAATLTEGLAAVLHNASPNAQAVMDEAGLAAVRDGMFPKRAHKELRAFARELRTRIDRLPEQTRQVPRTDLVEALWWVARHHLPAPTTRPGRFYTACEATFTLAGVSSSPERAIKAFKARSTGR